MTSETNMQNGIKLKEEKVQPDKQQIANIDQKNIQANSQASLEPGVNGISNSSMLTLDGLGKIAEPQQSTPLALNAIGSGNIMSNGLGNINMFPTTSGYKIIGGANLI